VAAANVVTIEVDTCEEGVRLARSSCTGCDVGSTPRLAVHGSDMEHDIIMKTYP
jgi:hypothetical protein